MRRCQFFGYFANLTKSLPDKEFNGAIERFMALASNTFDDIRSGGGGKGRGGGAGGEDR